MDDQRRSTGRKEWPCVGVNDQEKPCNQNLGNVIAGELVIDLSAVEIVNSEGVNVVLTCKQCGRPKRWFAKESAVQKAYLDYQNRSTAQQVVNMLNAQRT